LSPDFEANRHAAQVNFGGSCQISEIYMLIIVTYAQPLLNTFVLRLGVLSGLGAFQELPYASWSRFRWLGGRG
jgi:cytochrome c biogenesis factor